MKITEVKITGFKSFVDGVTLPISAGLTGIVGPNGCGKSNILEALRWVMGATSAKALRGGEMDDVIFQGTSTRPSRDIAEVLLKIDNSAGLAPHPFKNTPNLEISRKIRRGQGSSFRINGKEVRAKDIQLMFADASSGANSPALVRQGQVSELINARPENRRKVLEEAAGISGLQARRHEAEVKLNGTTTNLERIGEILIHMEEQISSLKKQAVRAQKYRKLQAQIRGLEMYIDHQKYLNFQKNLHEVEQTLNEAINQSNLAMVEHNRALRQVEELENKQKPLLEEQAIASAIMARFEAKKIEFDRDLQEASNNLENLRNSHSSILKNLSREKELFEDAQNAIKELEIEIQTLEKEDTNYDECNNLEIEKNEIDEIINSKQKIIDNFLNQKAKNKAKFDENKFSYDQLNLQIKNIETEKANLNAKIIEFEQNLINLQKDNKFSDEIKKAKENLNNFLQILNEKELNVQSLEKQEEEARKSLQGQNNSLNAMKAELRGIEAINNIKIANAKRKALDDIQVDLGYEKAFAAAMGEDCESEIGFSQNNHWLGAKVQEIIWPKDFDLKPLLNFVKAPNELKARLHAISLISDDDFDKIGDLPIGARIVTLNGRLKRWDGYVITGNSNFATAIKLEQINRANELKDLINKLEPEIKNQEKDFSILKNSLLNLRDELKKIRPNTNILNREIINAEQNQANHENKIENIKSNIMLYNEQILQLENKLSAAKTKIEDIGAIDFQKFENEMKNFDSEISKINDEINSLRAKTNQIAAFLINFKNNINEKIKKLDNAKNSINNWQNREKSTISRIKELEIELEQISKNLETFKNKPLEIEKERQKAIGEMPKIQTRKKAADDNLAIFQTNLREAIVSARSKENQYNASKEAINTAQILTQNWQERIFELENEILHNFANSAKDLNRIYEAELSEILKNLNVEKAQSRLSRALEEREDIGGVNLRADIELEEQNKRLSILSKERDDLFAAVKKLKAAIEEINAEGREKLINAFDIVNRHFIDLFTTLFEGGNAHLALTETEDPLGGGLEVYACPPGKRLSSMSLMSGGEQALTATALIFAVFLSNPAPISVLDELDAPLDDANVDRFCKLMDEMRKRTDTRFICITHHPITMARMDRLFGVTMAERGVSNVVSVDLSRAQTMIDNAFN